LVIRECDVAKRQIVHIDEELCNGCGLCVTPCAEGAIEIVDGKAHVISDALCDGAGFCLSICPTGALTVEVREAAEFDPAAAEEQARRREPAYIAQTCFRCGAGEERAVLMPCRSRGQSLWVCTRCLPGLIHG
jgi:NAD-dependent dihydropyrimidine dehydrogenase PreA subunit